MADFNAETRNTRKGGPMMIVRIAALSLAIFEIGPATGMADEAPARDTRGFVKLIKERGGDKLLGARVLAPEGGEQIMEAALAIRHGIGVSELATAFHPYLTQAEAIKLCAQTFTKDVSKLSCCSA